MKEAEEKLQLAKDNVTETEANIEEYAAAYADYYYDYHLDTYKERYENNYIYYYTFLEEYGMDESSVGGSGMGPSNGMNQTLVQNSGTSGKEPVDEKGEAEKEPGGNENGEGETEASVSGNSVEKQEDSAEKTERLQQTSGESLLLSLFTDSNKTLSGLTNSVSLRNGISLMSVSNSEQNNEDYARRLSILQQMKSNMETSQNYYYKAWNEYETAADQADSQLKKLEAQIEPLRAELSEAETTYQLELVEAETAYKKSLAQTELAQSDYKAAIQKAEDELEALEDEKIEAEENLAEFEAVLGDGYFYTKNSGTVMRMGTGSESYLQGGSMVVAYRNEKDISVTVSVAQEDIHKLKVGDSAQVMIEDYGTFEGKITYLNPVSNSGSRTNITYEVIVDLQGQDMDSLKENLTATVIFSVETER